jgi:hypothetical protein
MQPYFKRVNFMYNFFTIACILSFMNYITQFWEPGAGAYRSRVAAYT